MSRKLAILVKAKEHLFQTELVKYGVDSEKAAKLAYILASEPENQMLTNEEIQIFTDVGQKWLLSLKSYKQERLNQKNKEFY
ncbi:hypothetical protein H6G76_02100 [Nostoc sp. FACHB-152]|uniref:hypothetical protein n=1 Tax=unclassified Nostoc TaxID=2593658 RepID=UPI001686E742|nr:MULTISPECIES: hypothetical protein [unclassified Nostoc]MBD2445964.1 hypothetical protein [Nostoc sp. FACHB-152]MBD2467195.1 hypothetical protein [Nostoc sp. FACHB-145]